MDDTERQRWMTLHAQAVAELRACQGLLTLVRRSLPMHLSREIVDALAFTGGSVADVLEDKHG